MLLISRMIRVYTRAMYVCICKGITDREIVDAIDAGADSLSDIQEQLGAGTGCGTCRDFTEQLLDTTLAAKLGHAA